MKIYAYVEKGIGKSECQDRVLVGDTILAGGYLEMEYEDGNILVAVADGVGGYQGGERASLIAVDSIRVLNRRENLIETDIRALLENTNMQIKKAGQANHGYESMATTLTALVLNREKAISIHIGNCRLCSCKRQVLSGKKWQLISSIFWQLSTSILYTPTDCSVGIVLLKRKFHFFHSL